VHNFGDDNCSYMQSPFDCAMNYLYIGEKNGSSADFYAKFSGTR